MVEIEIQILKLQCCLISVKNALTFGMGFEIWYQNWNSDIGIEIPKSKSEFLRRIRNRNQNSDFYIETEIEIPISTKSEWNFVGISIFRKIETSKIR
jgi:hypothetical protein